eukprot:scaffold1328_cov162-Amphora_coffeaeformis.AAC.23
MLSLVITPLHSPPIKISTRVGLKVLESVNSRVHGSRGSVSARAISVCSRHESTSRSRFFWRGADGLVWRPSIAPLLLCADDFDNRKALSWRSGTTGRSFGTCAVHAVMCTTRASPAVPPPRSAASDYRTLLRQRRRMFSKESTDDTSDEEAEKERMNRIVLREKLSLSKPMDRDFQKYLTGEMPPLVSDRPRRRRQRLPDPDKELFARIQMKQVRKKEESRLKTAQNVNRALMGNVIICFAKLGAWVSSGSSAMLAEFIHSIVDCGNQALLLVGLRDSRLSPDRTHPYGYGKSVYFWALVSALGTFFLGAGVSMTHAIGDVMEPSLHEITWHVWGVLLLSLAVDGYVFGKTVAEIRETQPKGKSFYQHLWNIRDPATLAILLEDGAACLGVVMALGGIVATHATQNPIFDGLAGVGISALLGGMGIALVRVNHRFLLGRAVDKEIIDDINKILMSRRSIDTIGSVQSQWTGPDTFSYKAEVDFDGTYLAATLMKFYQQEFLKIRDSMEDELQVLLAFYSEDVMRTVEREVRKSEALIRQKYPGAEYIELEPMSVDVDRLAIDDNLEAELRRVEGEALDRFLRSLRAESATSTAETTPPSEVPSGSSPATPKPPDGV